MVLRDPLRDGHQVCLRLFLRYTVFLSTQDSEVVIVTIRDLKRCECYWNPYTNVALQELKARRQNADYRIPLVVQKDIAPYNAQVAAVAPLPKAIAQYCNFFRAGLVFIRRKGSADYWLNAEQRKEIGGNPMGEQPFRFAIAG